MDNIPGEIKENVYLVLFVILVVVLVAVSVVDSAANLSHELIARLLSMYILTILATSRLVLRFASPIRIFCGQEPTKVLAFSVNSFFNPVVNTLLLSRVK